VLVTGVLLTLINFAVTLRRGRAAGPDPWSGDTLEWSEQSPPANAQFAAVPVVRSRHPMWDQTTLKPVAGDDEMVTRAARALDNRPERWRGSLIVGVTDGRPLALAHLPRRSIWPFVVSVGFLVLFTAALLEITWIALAGLGVTAVGLGGWFWPVDTETVAIRESADQDAAAAGLPLAVGNRTASGYWGTCVLLVILGTASATFIAAYFYLGQGPSPLPPTVAPPPLEPALWATAAALLAGVATRWLTSAVDRGRDGARRAAVLAAVVAQATLLALGVAAWRAADLDAASSGYASGVLGVLGFQWLVAAWAAVMLAAALVWAVAKPGDPRGRGVALNASLVSYFSAANWLVCLAVVHLWPRLV
jgi:cytochrome c oxidase subunit I+III